MKLFCVTFFLIIQLTLFRSHLGAQSAKYPVRSNAPVGTYLKGSELIAKKGYKFEYKVKGDHSTVVLLDNNGVTKGEMTCECSKGSGSGSCEMGSNGQSLVCLPGGCSSCIMVLDDLSNSVKYTLSRGR